MKRILLLLIAISIFSCKDDKNYTLSGTASGFADSTQIMVYNFKENQPNVIDTIYVKEGKFSAKYPKPTLAELYFLRPNNTNGTIIFFPENNDLNVTIYKDSLYASKVEGSQENDDYTAFSKKMFVFNTSKQKNMDDFRLAKQANDSVDMEPFKAINDKIISEETEYKKEFIKEHNNSIFIPMLVSEMLQRQELTVDEAKEIINGLDPRIKDTELVKELNKNLEAMTAAEIGGKAPAFSAPTPEGNTLALNDAMGKYTIIDFWASWCKPCRAENPNVVAVYNKYHEKGLNIISVSLDKAEMKDAWIKAIADDKMDWFHVSNLSGWEDPIAQQYSVRSIPQTLLLDENGMIIEKNLRGPALGAKMEELLGESI